jgi:hypothetical protein
MMMADACALCYLFFLLHNFYLFAFESPQTRFLQPALAIRLTLQRPSQQRGAVMLDAVVSVSTKALGVK